MEAKNEVLRGEFMSKIRTAVVLLVVYFMFYITGLIFNTDMLNAITPGENGFSVSFIGILLLLITSIVVLKIINKVQPKKQ
jgi:hypothetical protein